MIAWALDLFDFRKRLLVSKTGISLLLSLSISPILVYLPYLQLSLRAVWGILSAFLFVFFGILVRELKKKPNASLHKTPQNRYRQWLALGIGGLWVLVSILCLVDLQFGNRLFITVESYDYSTRVAVIDAITRTGVPPINPSYYPGHPEPLTFLYYFWYILCSLVDQIGGPWVDARTALFASVAWCGLGLIALVALYIRFRNQKGGGKAWRSALSGVALLTVSGLDIIPVLLFHTALMGRFGFLSFNGDLEHWNEQITAWVGSVIFVPNHVTGVIACMTGLMLFQFVRSQAGFGKRVLVSIIIGLAFASALGLTVWVTLVFAVFWGLWMIEIFLVERKRGEAGLMAFSGIIAMMTSIPFILGILTSGFSSGGASEGSTITYAVREFQPVMFLINNKPPITANLINLLLLPINYLLELGFFFIVGFAWFQNRGRIYRRSNPYHTAEILLLLTVAVIATFIRSTVISSNDLGWRAWMFGQFVLIVWATDLIPILCGKEETTGRSTPSADKERLKLRRLLIIFLVIGVLTSVVDLALLRIYPILGDSYQSLQKGLVPDANQGKRHLAGRQTYLYLRDHTPVDIILQYNPEINMDRPSGLYGTRQIVISDHSGYGVPLEDYQTTVDGISPIFTNRNFTSWLPIDRICRSYGIEVIVFVDTDPAWASLVRLETERNPLYQNDYYRVFACGENARN